MFFVDNLHENFKNVNHSCLTFQNAFSRLIEILKTLHW